MDHFLERTWSQLGSNPLNWILAAFLLYVVKGTFFQSNPFDEYRQSPISHRHPPCIVFREYTPRELARYNGHAGGGGGRGDKGRQSASDFHGQAHFGGAAMAGTRSGSRRASKGLASGSQATPRILIAVMRQVFDVTSGASFYGPEGPYGNFAGRDASRGLAKNTFDDDVLTPLDQPIDTLADLKPSERESLQDWYGHFASKYTLVGRLVEEAGTE